MARKLKVFQSQFGFYDTVVAAPSQAAALRAWGTHQNLFAHGEAALATDEAAVVAALEHPETPLRRAVGSNDPFRLEPTSLPKVPDAPVRSSKKPSLPRKTAQPKRPVADRSALDAAEATLRKLDAARLEEEAEFRRRQEAIEEARSAAQAAYVQARRRATGAVVEARKAYRAAGGKD